MTYIILSNDQLVKLPPAANPDYVRRVLESELGAGAPPDLAARQPQKRNVFRQVARWFLSN